VNPQDGRCNNKDRFTYILLTDFPGRLLTLPWHGQKCVCRPYVYLYHHDFFRLPICVL